MWLVMLTADSRGTGEGGRDFLADSAQQRLPRSLAGGKGACSKASLTKGVHAVRESRRG